MIFGVFRNPFEILAFLKAPESEEKRFLCENRKFLENLIVFFDEFEMIPAVRNHTNAAFFNIICFLNLVFAEFRNCEDFFCIFCDIFVMEAAVSADQSVFEGNEIPGAICGVNVMQEGKTTIAAEWGSVTEIKWSCMKAFADFRKIKQIPSRKTL